MEVDQYVAARYGRLIEHAVLLGCAEGEAAAYVDQVLLEQRKRIRRADDPDPLVREALERAITGTRDSRSHAGPLVALGLVVVAVAVGAALSYRPAPEAMPSLFALTGDQAEDVLRAEGYDVQLRPVRSCEPPGLVVGSDPPSGGPVEKGATVVVRTSVLSGSHCEPAYPARSAAWEFVQFALGRGPAPEFAPTVEVVVDGGPPVTLRGDAAAGLLELEELTTAVAAAARATRPSESGLPVLVVRLREPPATSCDPAAPAVLGQRSRLRFQIVSRPAHEAGCPLTVDLYRRDTAIEAVIVSTSRPTWRQAVRLVPGRPAVVQRFEMIWDDDGPQPRPDHEHRGHRD